MPWIFILSACIFRFPNFDFNQKFANFAVKSVAPDFARRRHQYTMNGHKNTS